MGMGEHDEHKGFTVTDRRSVTADGEPATAASPAPDPKALPQVDFTMLVMSLGSSVLMHLGELAESGEPGHLDLPLAKQTIDIIGMLQEKTKGNLTDEEARLLEHLLFDLRLKFVDVRKRT